MVTTKYNNGKWKSNGGFKSIDSYKPENKLKYMILKHCNIDTKLYNLLKK